MKKYIILTTVAVIAAFACSKVEPLTEEPVITEEPATPVEPATTLTYYFNVAEKPSLGGTTKAIKHDWEEGDLIYVVFDKVCPTQEADLLILKYSSGDWKVIQQPFNTPTSASGTLDALYLENPNPPIVAGSNNLDFENTSGNPLNCASYMYLVHNDVPYTISNGQLSADLNLSFDSNSNYCYVRFRIGGLDDGWKIQISGETHRFAVLQYGQVWGDGRKFKFMFRSLSSTYWYSLGEKHEDGYYKYVRFKRNNSIGFTLSKDGVGAFIKTFTNNVTDNEAVYFTGPVPPEGKTLAEMSYGETTSNGWRKN